jgi:hypothetical protein
MARVQYFPAFLCCAIAAILSAACGGSVVVGPASGGGPAAGGSPATGGAAAGGASAGSGSGSGSQSGGAPGGSCLYQGNTYSDGQNFPASDGCNSCSCRAGSASCTLRACQTDCAALQDQYAEALKRAKACDPAAQTAQCKGTVANSLPCGCPTPVNESNGQALIDISSLGTQAAGSCISLCPACLPPGPATTCTPAGSCEYAPLRAGEVSCKVDGVVYPSGTTGIPEPMDGCNKCSCENGELSCTEIGCPSQYSCPAGTKFGTQCAQCGPTDACQIIEYACLPSCAGSCVNGFCSGGICRQACG